MAAPSSLSCMACGAAGAPCCDTTSTTGQAKAACASGAACGADHMCPNIPPGWAGDPCGTDPTQPKCQGSLMCKSNTCVCDPAKSSWLTCSADGTKVCARGAGPPPTGKYSGRCGTEHPMTNKCNPTEYMCWDGKNKGQCTEIGKTSIFDRDPDCAHYCSGDQTPDPPTQ